MRFNVFTSSLFDKEFKKLCKKHKSAKSDVIALVEKLKESPISGTPIGNDCYKIRLAIASKGKGKSAGARLITNIRFVNETIYLLSIYDKADKETLSDRDLIAVLKTL
ncbi:hypothetical protein EZJ43_02475 [Pedobacter changchengzhani]|uniref:Addiction module toxin RelE n=1 Tax=Pedobacter changchengzhani TaxID=2529274 RepID=A0A4R5MR11_9SPHI|nr:type II toxin-antitoxin system RelE/ParE family toxin [Pedobacter changchengzhani]TDG37975.1 hypothetical protein EZJ43_02475 [Pedobacter changchengzhani]